MVGDQSRAPDDASSTGGRGPAPVVVTDGDDRHGVADTGRYLPALTLSSMSGVLLLACLPVLVATADAPGDRLSRAVLLAGVAAVAVVALALTVLNALRVRAPQRAGTVGRAGLPLLAAALGLPVLTAVVVALAGGMEWPASAALLALALPCLALAFVGLATWSSNRRPTRLLDQPGSARRTAGFLAMTTAGPLGLVVIALLGALTGDQDPAVTRGAVAAGVVVSVLAVVNLVRVVAPGAALTPLVRLLAAVAVLAPVALVVVLLTGGAAQGWGLVVSGWLFGGWAWLVFLVMATLEAGAGTAHVRPGAAEHPPGPSVGPAPRP